jgi:hypothetical protein
MSNGDGDGSLHSPPLHSIARQRSADAVAYGSQPRPDIRSHRLRIGFDRIAKEFVPHTAGLPARGEGSRCLRRRGSRKQSFSGSRPRRLRPAGYPEGFDGYGDLHRRTSFAGRQAVDYLHRHKSPATSGDESGSAPKLRKWRFFNRIAIWHFSGIGGTSGLFSDEKDEFNFRGEQFWGRAARASRTRKSLGTLVIFRVKISDFRAVRRTNLSRW